MLNTWTILIASFGYVGLLFAIAYYGDKRADEGHSIVSNPYIYALSMAVYCTAWTFYGSVGRAVNTGVGFMPIYLGPTLMATLGWLVLRKIIHISKIHRITTIADFISSRYGKSATLGGLVTIIAVLGIVPYISLQLKAISTTFHLISSFPDVSTNIDYSKVSFAEDNAFYIAWALALFAILFGTRHLETTERHEGLVAAIAFESIVKLAAFLAVGIFVTFGIFDGFGDLFGQAAAVPAIKKLFVLSRTPETYAGWTMYVFLAMLAIICLPRQFQVIVVENVDKDHLNKAIWLFPLYMLVINIFVLPVAFGGMMAFPDGSVDADTFVLSLPMIHGQAGLALFVYIGGLSAATGMVIVETVALSTMLSNNLIVPVLLKIPFGRFSELADFTGFLLVIRRTSIVGVVLLGYLYFHLIGEHYTLVSIGLISFTAVAQFAPAIIGGLFWKGGNRNGALAGLGAGFAVWAYTLVLPSMAQAGWLPWSFITRGPMGISLLKPFSLFGLKIGMTPTDPIANAVFFSMLANVGAYVVGSLFSRSSAMEHTQAALFVDVFRFSRQGRDSPFWRGTASIPDLRALLARCLGEERADYALFAYAQKRNLNWDKNVTADAGLVEFSEKLLAGAIGSASARVMVSSVVKEEPLGIEEVMGILDETRQVIAHSQELEKATDELRAANERLKELDSLKDEFISTVTHELRTPLTAVRSIAEIIHDSPSLGAERRVEFAGIIIKESERLTRLINQVLDFQKLESGRMEWQMAKVDLSSVLHRAVTGINQLIQNKHIRIHLDLPDQVPEIDGDRDRLVQVMINLVANAVKFCPADSGRIDISLVVKPAVVQINVRDNGSGITSDEQKIIFERFRQIAASGKGRPSGSGLGLSITKHIVEYHGGDIWVQSRRNEGTVFSFTLPIHRPDHHGDRNRP